MISKTSLKELEQILLEEFNLHLNAIELTNFASSLIGYFELLIKINGRNKYGKSQNASQ